MFDCQKYIFSNKTQNNIMFIQLFVHDSLQNDSTYILIIIFNIFIVLNVTFLHKNYLVNIYVDCFVGINVNSN